MNYLVYRYLLESGFTHAAFALGTEARPGKPEREIPPGALISFVQKGLQYLELEANLNDVRTFARWIFYFLFRFVSSRRAPPSLAHDAVNAGGSVASLGRSCIHSTREMNCIYSSISDCDPGFARGD